MTIKKYNDTIACLAWECKDADMDTIKQCATYYTSDESGNALGCDYKKVLTDILWQIRCF